MVHIESDYYGNMVYLSMSWSQMFVWIPVLVVRQCTVNIILHLLIYNKYNTYNVEENKYIYIYQIYLLLLLFMMTLMFLKVLKKLELHIVFWKVSELFVSQQLLILQLCLMYLQIPKR